MENKSLLCLDNIEKVNLLLNMVHY